VSEKNACDDDPCTCEWVVNADHDIRVASWKIADLVLGPDDGSYERDDVESQIQDVMKASFCETEGREPVFGPGAPTWLLERQEVIRRSRRRGH